MTRKHKRDNLLGKVGGMSTQLPQGSKQGGDAPSGKGMVAVQQEFSGPIPPPQALEAYERVLPGAAERILSMAERQSAHRQDLEAKAVNAQIGDMGAARSEARLGQAFGLIIGLTAIGAGTAVAVLNPDVSGAVTGSVIGGSGVVGLVTAFIIGRKHERPPEESTKPRDQQQM